MAITKTAGTSQDHLIWKKMYKPFLKILKRKDKQTTRKKKKTDYKNWSETGIKQHLTAVRECLGVHKV